MANYTDATEISNQLAYTIGAGTTPTSTHLAALLTAADSMINAEARVSSNMTDTYGELKTIATNLVLKMIRRLWSFRDPDTFPYEDVELTAEERRIIHRVHDKFTGNTWDPYESGSQ